MVRQQHRGVDDVVVAGVKVVNTIVVEALWLHDPCWSASEMSKLGDAWAFGDLRDPDQETLRDRELLSYSSILILRSPSLLASYGFARRVLSHLQPLFQLLVPLKQTVHFVNEL